MAQFQGGTTYTDVSPGNVVTATNLNAHVNAAVAVNGLVLDQLEKTVTVVDDVVLVGDSTLPATGVPKKVKVGNLLPETARQGVQQYAAGTLSGGVYAVTLSPAATVYTAGMTLRFKADSANAGAVDINVNTLGAKNLFTRAGGELAANDILANQVVEAVYDGTQFQVTAVISAGEITATHQTEAGRASVHQYITDSGAADAYVATLSPAATAYTAGMVVRFKATNANTGAATLNVNGLGTKNISRVVAGAVAALKAKDIQVADVVTCVYDGTQFVITGHVRSWDFVSAGTTAFPGSSLSAAVAHGLGATPTKVRVVALPDSTQNFYPQNEEVETATICRATTATPAFQVSADGTNVTISQTDNASLTITPKGGGALASMTTANWKLKVYASL